MASSSTPTTTPSAPSPSASPVPHTLAGNLAGNLAGIPASFAATLSTQVAATVAKTWATLTSLARPATAAPELALPAEADPAVPIEAATEHWDALKDDPGSRDADRLRFLVMERNDALLAVLTDPASGWVEQATENSLTLGPMRVWNGTDLNGQHYQVLLAAPAATAVL